jgi:ubiquinone biosynthesis protein COQ9
VTDEARGARVTDQALRDAILLAALPHVAFDGWTMAALRAGAAEAGKARHDLLHAFPEGAADAVAHFADWADRRGLEALAAADPDGIRSHEKVTLAVRARLEATAPWREAARRAAVWLAAPRHAALAGRLVWRTADRIWHAAGDASTDYNFYTKRGLLSGVVASTALYWLQDKSEGSTATWAFLDRRIDAVLAVGRRIGAVRKAVDRFDPAPFLRRVRRTA